MHRVKRSFRRVLGVALAEPMLDLRPPEYHAAAAFVVVDSFFEFTRTEKVADGLLAVRDFRGELLDGEVFGLRLAGYRTTGAF